ncbi:MAG: hypothetical protein N3A38_15480, partial [Planctomycetota bacterium]|nr:hypothetical protein [Planctomycetota bacterium]
ERVGETTITVPGGGGGLSDAGRQIGALIASLRFADGSTGTVRCAAARAGPVRFSNVHARIAARGAPGAFVLEDIRAECMGGKVRGRVEVDAPEDGSGGERRRPALRLVLDFEGVELRPIPLPSLAAGSRPPAWLASGCVRGGMTSGNTVDIGIAGRIVPPPATDRAGFPNLPGAEGITATITISPDLGVAAVREFSFRSMGAKFRGRAEIRASPWRPPFDAPGVAFEAGFSDLNFGVLTKALGLTGMTADWTLEGMIRGRRSPGEEELRADISVEARSAGLDRPPPMSGIAARLAIPDAGGALSVEEFSARAYGGEAWGRFRLGPFDTKRSGPEPHGACRSGGASPGAGVPGGGGTGGGVPGGETAGAGGAVKDGPVPPGAGARTARDGTTGNAAPWNISSAPFVVDIQFSDMKIADFLKDFGRGDLGCSGFLSGRVWGGRKEAGGAMAIRIRAMVRSGDLGRFPLAAAGPLESLVSSSKSCIENCDLDCELGPDGVEIRRFELSSIEGDFSLRAEPGGRLDREWRFRNFYLRPEAPKGLVEHVPLVGQFAEIIGEARRRVMRIKVEGTLFAPKVSLAPFHGPWGPVKE